MCERDSFVNFKASAREAGSIGLSSGTEVLTGTIFILLTFWCQYWSVPFFSVPEACSLRRGFTILFTHLWPPTIAGMNMQPIQETPLEHQGPTGLRQLEKQAFASYPSGPHPPPPRALHKQQTETHSLFSCGKGLCFCLATST